MQYPLPKLFGLETQPSYLCTFQLNNIVLNQSSQLSHRLLLATCLGQYFFENLDNKPKIKIKIKIENHTIEKYQRKKMPFKKKLENVILFLRRGFGSRVGGFVIQIFKKCQPKIVNITIRQNKQTNTHNTKLKIA